MEQPLLILCLVWLVYFLLHSILASLRVKSFVAINMALIMPWYRLLFNGIAVLALVPVHAYMSYLSGDIIWAWHAKWQWLSNSLAIIAITGFIHSLKYYDMMEFMGIRQIVESNQLVNDQEHLKISPYHRYVRHPWYFFAIVLIWTRNMDTAWLVSCVMLTLYFILGSKLEDRKLVEYYGDPYQLYKSKVSGVFPLPWLILSSAEGVSIEQNGNAE